ncbi:hypothetical protein B0H17DRAFT_1197780 [Mycena rosella]|uniref:BTB domain-containing protein n=1 Tax=Mycena rosella TaxID=1033263 RepID=A0AAD7DQE6_MYCRO|nr:hypothetical protein B0H17DRAFT_1197780 [Mycena rosella]
MPTHRPHADSTAKHLDVVSFTLLPLAYYIATASRSGDTSPFLRDTQVLNSNIYLEQMPRLDPPRASSQIPPVLSPSLCRLLLYVFFRAQDNFDRRYYFRAAYAIGGSSGQPKQQYVPTTLRKVLGYKRVGSACGQRTVDNGWSLRDYQRDNILQATSSSTHLPTPLLVMGMNPVSPTDKASPGAPIQDPKYFSDDGDCMFLAEGVLFKLHKLFLCRRGDDEPPSMFCDMFSMPQGATTHGNALSATDLNPITVTDTVDDFRALCWALYALPIETQLQNDPGADIPRLVSVAKMSHKYNLPSFETWALRIVWLHCQPNKELKDYLDDCPQNMVIRIFDVADAGNFPNLSSIVEKQWLARLKTGELLLRIALDFGEARGRRTFLGDVYYQQAMDMVSFVPSMDTSQVADFSHLNLTHAQTYNLLRGYCSLSLFWERLEKHIIPLRNICGGGLKHTQSLVYLLPPERRLDIRKGLRDMEARNNLKGYRGHSCACGTAYIQELLSSIPDHFLGNLDGEA